MDFVAVVDQAIALLRQRGRLTYRTLQLQFQLDAEHLEALKDELIEGQRLAADEAGRVLVWTGDPVTPGSPASPSSLPAPLPAASSPPEAERRQLTVLFCDLVDSTVLATQLDPEDLREVVRAYQATCAEVIRRFDGHIAQYLGDGLLVYFGYPLAHEDDAQRAVRAGLGMVEALGQLNTRLAREWRVRLAVRIGIHTGPVVVGEMGDSGRQEQLAFGETPNVAARLQGLATPDTVVISAATWRLVRGYFRSDALGAPALKGVTAPVHVYRILGAGTAQSRLDVARLTGFTPLVGREAEITLLLERWVQSQAGMGQVVLVRGEAGIGKSRLVEALHERGRSAGATDMVVRCSPLHQQSPLYPVIAYLQRVVQWQRDDPSVTRLDRLEQVLHTARLPLADVVPLFAALLSVPLGDRYPPVRLTPQEQRQQTHTALVTWLLAEAERQPVLAVWEDLHWADPSTLEVLRLVLDQLPTARMLTLLTCRPEFQPPWATCAPLTQITLSRLGRPEVEAMLTSLTQAKPLPAEVVAQVLAKTDGVPLFVEELVKMILESALVREEAAQYVLTGPLPPLAIPSTLHDSLMARLDRLSTARPLAQLGAVLGREFAYEVLQAVAAVDETTFQQGLAQLVDAELVYQRGLPPGSHYIFKHALIQDAAYHSLLKSTRQQYHQRIAQVLAARFPEIVETQPEVLAQHYTEAGLAQHAVTYWQQAGQRANARSAYVEAIAHCTHGLEVLKLLPETPERMQHELTLCLALGTPLIATKGYGAPDVEHVFSQALALCAQGGHTAQRIQVLIGLFVCYEMRGALRRAQELADEFLPLAQQQPETALLLRACGAGGQVFWLRGDLAAARTIFERGMAVYDPQRHSPQVLGTWQDAGVTCLSYAALTLWLQGYPDQARERSRHAHVLSDTLSHPFTRVWAAYLAAQLYRLLRDIPQSHAHVEHVRTLAAAQGYTQFSATRTMGQGGALATPHHAADEIAQLHEGLVANRAKGTEMQLPYLLARLAEAYHRQGQSEEGLTVLADALALVDKNDERWWEAELHRLKGACLLQQAIPDAAQAARCFEQALAVACQQHAKSLELRAAVSLSRLWQQQGKRAEAYERLAPIYGWFTEGFDTADLQEAKTLLEELGA